MNNLFVGNFILQNQIKILRSRKTIKTILRSRKRLIKNIKITIREEEIFIRIENNSKKIKRFIEININDNQAILVLSYIDYRKSYISVCDNKISSYTLCNNRNLNIYTNDEMRYIGMKRLIKNEVLYCILQKISKVKISKAQMGLFQ